ncbi:hypothetical protein E0W68_05025 [Flavobacterium salilacus subsp. salilacus]|uniref:hypothetical protein n=1 Tax=Flavobacterium TaxID=237 RepID=UPI0010752E8C|nr:MULTISPECIES: hypothetical protein [Flavobacterium]KAF2519136.1 hypothetical protein E0W68_05025 [Flavobacterium salilacus subsp. salilacus]MBE1613315.1 hypothetical protein [Flavobacterium sp. SaA2.13]
MKLPVRHIHILTLLLTMVIATPCSIKKLYADFVGIETSHKPNNGNVKVQCHVFVADEKENGKEETALLTSGFESFYFTAIPQESNSITTPGFFFSLKEKVPTYLLCRSLLI